MFFKKREKDNLKQQRTRQYIRVILGAYLVYLAYGIIRDLRMGVQADRPLLFWIMAVLFGIGGSVLFVISFVRAMRVASEELTGCEENPEEKKL